MQGSRKRRRPRKTCRDEAEEDLNIMRMKKGLALVRGRREWRNILLEAKVQIGL